MGSYFHVIERKVGGNLDAFRRELGRLRESGHFHRDRHERIMRIAKTVGFGHIVRQCLVDTGHRAGCEVHVLTSTGIVFVFNAHSRKLITVLVARPGQVARYYEPFGEDVAERLWKHKLGMDTAVCRAESKEAAVAQLLPEMRDCVEYVSQRWAMRDCYPNPKGILRDEVI